MSRGFWDGLRVESSLTEVWFGRTFLKWQFMSRFDKNELLFDLKIIGIFYELEPNVNMLNVRTNTLAKWRECLTRSSMSADM